MNDLIEILSPFRSERFSFFHMERYIQSSMGTIPSESNIEGILVHSVELFYNTGMPELARKWERILENYRLAKQLHQQSA
jgi:hypothetical protein